jgi:hypothetical protein
MFARESLQTLRSDCPGIEPYERKGNSTAQACIFLEAACDRGGYTRHHTGMPDGRRYGDRRICVVGSDSLRGILASFHDPSLGVAKISTPRLIKRSATSFTNRRLVTTAKPLLRWIGEAAFYPAINALESADVDPDQRRSDVGILPLRRSGRRPRSSWRRPRWLCSSGRDSYDRGWSSSAGHLGTRGWRTSSGRR